MAAARAAKAKATAAKPAAVKPVARPPVAVQVLPKQELAPSPPQDADLKTRLAWADAEADQQRARIAKLPFDEQLRFNVAWIAAQVTRDIELALAIDDIDNAAVARQLIEKKLSDTRWRLNWMVQRAIGGGAAEFALAVMSQHGMLEARDAAMACQRFGAAWSKGFLDAAYRLGACHQDKQPEQAAALLRASADAGHPAASDQIARRCLAAKPPDTRCAYHYLAAAASSGRASAKSLLGYLYAQGAGVERDPAVAEKLYREAAAAGDASARNNLGEMYETGRGVKADAGRAVEFYRQAAESGFAPAQFNLGRAYAAGSGIERDADLARLWLRRALQGGAQPAKTLLDWLDDQEARARVSAVEKTPVEKVLVEKVQAEKTTVETMRAEKSQPAKSPAQRK